jgi:hypothetical protein
MLAWRQPLVKEAFDLHESNSVSVGRDVRITCRFYRLFSHLGSMVTNSVLANKPFYDTME